MSRLDDLDRFYALLEVLAAQQAGGRLLGQCDGRMHWPSRGVYFLFEPGEVRSDSGSGARVVRVGTHAVARGSRSTLWSRLSQHRGTRAGSGSHRGSIFRLLVGEALLARAGRKVDSWGLSGSRGDAARRLGHTREQLAGQEGPIEASVSDHLRGMRLLILEVDDPPGPQSLRAYIERHSIALLSDYGRPGMDASSAGWLGQWSRRAKVRESGLWNQDHVGAQHAPAFLDVIERMVVEPTASAPARPSPISPNATEKPMTEGLFSGVSSTHVRAAARRIDRDGVPKRRAARSTVAFVADVEYPAKYLLGLAYEAAHGAALDPERYTGGMATARVLNALGFDVVHRGNRLQGSRPTSAEGAPTPPPTAAPRPAFVTEAPTGMLAASVAMTGTVSHGAEDNAERAELLVRIAASLVGPGRPGDCAVVVLPGGYFRLGLFVGHLDADERRAAIEAADFATACQAAATVLATAVPGAVLVVGVDSVPGVGEWADQMAVAWGDSGVVGVGRKIFPVAGRESAGLVVNAADFGDAGRNVQLPGGRRGVLCSCYDAYGVSAPRKRAHPIERLRVEGGVLHHTEGGFDDAWEEAVAGWSALIDGVDAALIATHGFGGRGNASLWQRHGISTASAALDGGLAIAGAHFEKLPRSPQVQVLASSGVPRSHLGKGPHRKGESLPPSGATLIGDAMVRWFPWA